MSISSDEINYLIYRYLQENGFTHSAFSFANESLVTSSSVSQTEIPPGNFRSLANLHFFSILIIKSFTLLGSLITFLQKGLEYIGIEEHINQDGSIREFNRDSTDYTLLSPFICDAVALKEDRKSRKVALSTLHHEPHDEQLHEGTDKADMDPNGRFSIILFSIILINI